MTRRLAATPKADGGFGLVEMLVAMFVGSLVMGAATVIFNVTLQSSRATQSRVDGINAARVATEAMSRSLRTAVLPTQLDASGSFDAAFLQAAPRAVFFYANINNPGNAIGPSRVSYQVIGNNLVQTIQAPLAHAANDHDYKYCDLAQTTCARSTLLLTSGVDAGGIFTYYDRYGSVLSPSVACTVGTCLDATSLENVDAVEIRVAVSPPAGVRVGPSTYFTRVALPNHDAVIRDGK
ncbi:MAG: hypothetical protein JWN77_1835 [Frankiales bacterium]|jgi:prepilin-type N-terminal cleavage/methylation domain-containing protein|nr:hypothetical protein [Frankiales bacterium]